MSASDLPALNLRPGQCKWPLSGWNPRTRRYDMAGTKPTHFCCAPTFADKPYCREHWAISHNRVILIRAPRAGQVSRRLPVTVAGMGEG